MKPMKSSDLKNAQVKYPVYASPKLDGIRCVIKDGKALSNSLKPINTPLVQGFPLTGMHGFDGELIYGSPCDSNTFLKTSHCVMSKTVPSDVEPSQLKFYVFDDWIMDNQPYSQRLLDLKNDVKYLNHSNVVLVEQRLVHSDEELLAYEEDVLSQGYEGVMLRSPQGVYKFGRSTLKEGYLLKVKRFVDTEAVIVGFEEEMQNTNDVYINELGNSTRSTKKEGMVPKGRLGKLIVDHPTFGEVKLGTGLNDNLKKTIWNNQEEFLGQLVTFKYFDIGNYDKPRLPVFKGIRHRDDMTTY